VILNDGDKICFNIKQIQILKKGLCFILLRFILLHFLVVSIYKYIKAMVNYLIYHTLLRNKNVIRQVQFDYLKECEMYRIKKICCTR